MRRVLAAGLLALALGAACGRPAGSLSVSLVPPTAAAKAFISVTGFSSSELASLETFTSQQWPSLITILVDGPAESNPPVAGQYRVTPTSVDFIPTFPFDPGRGYVVLLDPGKLPARRAAAPFRTILVMPAVLRSPTTTVTAMWPSADVLPENLLRIYLEFSAPMSRADGRDFLKLVDERGVEVRDALLALDVDFWSPDGRRYTVFLDPGRVKRGILPNDQIGRALKPGRRFALVVDPAWRDGNGQPLAAPFTREFGVEAAVMAPLRVQDWVVQSPASNVQRPLVVRFPRPLDHGLLQRAIGVERDGKPVHGDITIAARETEWRFTPRRAWAAGAYNLIVLSMLEDPMGNTIGRAFDVDRFTEIDRSAAPERATIPFVVR